MSGRLSLVKVCAVCGDRFHPYRVEAVCCSRRCCGIRRQKMYPHLCTFKEANAANKARRDAKIVKLIEGMTALEAFTKGYRQGYGTCYQRYVMRRAS